MLMIDGKNRIDSTRVFKELLKDLKKTIFE
jgi:hypothetical protein